MQTTTFSRYITTGQSRNRDSHRYSFCIYVSFFVVMTAGICYNLNKVEYTIKLFPEEESDFFRKMNQGEILI